MSTVDLSLDGDVVIVTGASQGLGEVMAMGLANAGARVVVASIDGEGARRVCDQIGADRSLAVAADISVKPDCDRIVASALKQFGNISALVNNARRTPPEENRPFWESPVEFWEASIRINVFGTYLMTRAAAPYFIERRYGRIINISTSLDTMQRKSYSPYGVTKAAIDACTTIWSKDLADYGVTVNTLIPGGACDTRKSRTRPPSRSSEILPASIMTPPVIWLASRRSEGFTGLRFVAKSWGMGGSLDESVAHSIEPSIFRQC